jgi:hypothetical protein
LRPLTAAERVEIERERKPVRNNAECTTEPKFLDSARVMLTAVAKPNATIRLSRFETPGCAGHLVAIYVLDVHERGRDPRRFLFRHFVGLL